MKYKKMLESSTLPILENYSNYSEWVTAVRNKYKGVNLKFEKDYDSGDVNFYLNGKSVARWDKEDSNGNIS